MRIFEFETRHCSGYRSAGLPERRKSRAHRAIERENFFIVDSSFRGQNVRAIADLAYVFEYTSDPIDRGGSREELYRQWFSMHK
jgi:hypothetical protein